MRRILLDYFGEWTTGRLSRTRFFALCAGMVGLLFVAGIMLGFLLLSLGLLDPLMNGQEPEILARASFQLASLTPAQLPIEQLPAQQHLRFFLPNLYWVPLSHLMFANISMKRLRDMGIAGGWFYLGIHLLIAGLQFGFAQSGPAGLILFIFCLFLLFMPSDAFR